MSKLSVLRLVSKASDVSKQLLGFGLACPGFLNSWVRAYFFVLSFAAREVKLEVRECVLL